MQQHFIDNRPVPSSTGEFIPVIDPSTGQEFDAIPRGNAADIDRAVSAARKAYEGAWGALTAAERGRLLLKLSLLVMDHFDELAAIESRDCGKPTQAGACRRHRHRALLRVLRRRGGQAAWRNPALPERLYGPDPARTAWRDRPHRALELPLQIFGRSVGGALAAGNACVVKPAEDACLSVLRIAELAAEAGFPPGAINVVTGYGHEAGDALARHPGIDHISFTGSPAIGILVTQTAAANRHAGHDRTGRQVAANRLRRRGLRRHAAGGDQRHRAERRADLLRGQPAAGTTPGLRSGAGESGRRLCRAAHRSAPTRTWTAGR